MKETGRSGPDLSELSSSSNNEFVTITFMSTCFKSPKHLGVSHWMTSRGNNLLKIGQKEVKAHIDSCKIMSNSEDQSIASKFRVNSLQIALKLGNTDLKVQPPPHWHHTASICILIFNNNVTPQQLFSEQFQCHLYSLLFCVRLCFNLKNSQIITQKT